MTEERLLTTRGSIYLVDSPYDSSSSDSPLLNGEISLSLISPPSTSTSIPPRIPPKPESLSIPGHFSTSSTRSSSPTGSIPPPLPPRSTSPSSSSSSSRWLQLTLTVPGDHEPLFSMPINYHRSEEEVTSFPLDNAYILPNLSGVDPSTLPPSSSSSGVKGNGYIKVKLDSTLPPEDRETFESIVCGSHPSFNSPATNSFGGGSSLEPRRSHSTNPFDDDVNDYDESEQVVPMQLERNQLYVVDETNGKVIGQLEGGGGSGGGVTSTTGGINLEESSELLNGRTHDHQPSTSTTTGGMESFDLDGKEAVVIDTLDLTEGGGGAGGTESKYGKFSNRFSVRPLSTVYKPAENPNGSTIISMGNYVSHGLMIGSSLLAQGIETGAGKFVSSRPATQSPLVFKETTKARWEKGNWYTGRAVEYTGKGTKAIANYAAGVGDKIGKKTGIQRDAGTGQAPTGVRGLISKSLVALNTVGDALDASGKTLMDSTQKSASQVAHHKWGGEAREIVDHAGGSIRHCALVYIDARGVTRRALLTAVGKGALKAKMADGSQLYLTDSSTSSSLELKQIEAAASSLETNSSTTTTTNSNNAPPRYTPPSHSPPQSRNDSPNGAAARSPSGSGTSAPSMLGGYPVNYKSYESGRKR